MHTNIYKDRKITFSVQSKSLATHACSPQCSEVSKPRDLMGRATTTTERDEGRGADSVREGRSVGGEVVDRGKGHSKNDVMLMCVIY